MCIYNVDIWDLRSLIFSITITTTTTTTTDAIVQSRSPVSEQNTVVFGNGGGDVNKTPPRQLSFAGTESSPDHILLESTKSGPSPDIHKSKEIAKRQSERRIGLQPNEHAIFDASGDKAEQSHRFSKEETQTHEESNYKVGPLA